MEEEGDGRPARKAWSLKMAEQNRGSGIGMDGMDLCLGVDGTGLTLMTVTVYIPGTSSSPDYFVGMYVL